MKKFVYFVNSIPFAGKLTIRPFAYCYWHANTVRKKAFWFAGLVALLVVLITAHVSQAQMGFANFNPAKSVLLNTIFIFYGMVNLAVSFAQAHLLMRAIGFLFKSLPKKTTKYVEASGQTMLLCIAVTFSGQIIFIVASFLSRL